MSPSQTLNSDTKLSKQPICMFICEQSAWWKNHYQVSRLNYVQQSENMLHNRCKYFLLFSFENKYLCFHPLKMQRPSFYSFIAIISPIIETSTANLYSLLKKNIWHLSSLYDWYYSCLNKQYCHHQGFRCCSFPVMNHSLLCVS